jgi:WXXGXW repeat (2 copies)
MKRALLLSALVAGTVLMTGCVATVQSPPVYGTVRMVDPPPPRHEYQGYPPAVGYVWMSGYWNWVGVRYDWVPGRWSAPRPGHVWVPHVWHRDGDRWHQRGGRWEEDRRYPPPRVQEHRRDRDDDHGRHPHGRDDDRKRRERFIDRDGDGRPDRWDDRRGDRR